MRTVSAVLRPGCCGLVLLALGGCGGGGSGGGGSGESGGGPANASADANASGLWQGDFASNDGTTRDFNLIVAPDGRFAGIIASSGGNGRFVVGTSDTVLSTFHATGTVFAQAGELLLPNGQASDPLTVSGGAVVDHVSLTGELAGGGESGPFSLMFDGNTYRAASLEAISGVYAGFPLLPGGVYTSTLVVNGNSVTFANDAGCNGAGTVDVIDAHLNVYSWSMLIGACSGVSEHTVSGLATLGDNGRNGILIAVYGATAADDLPFVFRGFR